MSVINAIAVEVEFNSGRKNEDRTNNIKDCYFKKTRDDQKTK